MSDGTAIGPACLNCGIPAVVWLRPTKRWTASGYFCLVCARTALDSLAASLRDEREGKA